MTNDATLTRSTWPIAAAALPFASTDRHGRDATHAGEEAWHGPLGEVRRCGFTRIDLTDSWIRPGDLGAEGLAGLTAALNDHGLRAASLSVIRRSVIDDREGDANLAYSHRSIDAAAELGITTVSVGLHQALSAEQQRQLWFWTATGHVDRAERWSDAVARLRELGAHAESLGIVLSLEMYEDTFLGTAESAVRLVTEIDNPRVGLNPDIGNLVRLHRPIESWREAFEATLPYTNFWHMKNYSRSESADGSIVSTAPSTMDVGIIDYRWAVGRAIELGFRGVMCLENYGGDGLSVCARNRDYLRQYILPERLEPSAASLVVQPALDDVLEEPT
ncbi:MAG: sugar phosphate isomerase/epimerase [Microcella sp.]|uniref:sugar phosphate isomerase/epimerase family protein n=1 Tax=Microcella sp. TaxID=1913979 RepID=UPI0024C651CC|nr:sugar phosphate isomerase/epimerase family protein [Microcella sp.]UYN83449.1 MAG: sugar phosphate isomerase/epimerase [Microcella sp.]